ncbi:hypothetical protein Hypma_015936 [Hypsizygus marmoreus]|uniref:Uncharacterized protein n=1 Tax=Hypsizygus marmoreus TaxID=39966 RepID=A0A369K8X9_HYPMA|nr:hypothetical protein Hypma_015936 [Hypsizygus marmoreus]
MPSTTTPQVPDETTDPFIAYSRALYNYTFRLWKESQRASEDRARLTPRGKGEEEEGKKPTQSTHNAT